MFNIKTMKSHLFLLPVILLLLLVSGCDITNSGGNVTPPVSSNPFYVNNRMVFDGYTYTDNSGNTNRNLNITFTSVGAVGFIQNVSAYGIVDSTFNYNSTTGVQGSLIRKDTLYFSFKDNGDLRFLSYGYYKIIPRWIDLYRFGSVNLTYYQNFNEIIDGVSWQLQIASLVTNSTLNLPFNSALPVYKLEQTLTYLSPYNVTLKFYWYWNPDYGLVAYDEYKNTLILQIAKSKNF